jgi:hypothetical protein
MCEAVLFLSHRMDDILCSKNAVNLYVVTQAPAVTSSAVDCSGKYSPAAEFTSAPALLGEN